MSGPSVSNLFPAIAQSFAVIIIGYVFGFFKIIPVSEARSIGTLVGKLALPALLFKNLAILDLSAISWPFLGAMLVAKFSLFAVVALVTVIISRPFNIGKAGIFGIFVTQSNDFALGLPIVQALYPVATVVSEFDYASYIYLLAPVSLAIINPIGFVFMEFQRQFSNKKLQMKQIPLIMLRTVKGVVFNPVIFMTALGLIVNVFVTFGLKKTEDKLPSWLTGFLDILGGAYAACALFNIGIFMVGKMKKITLNLVLVATLLILAKTIILPIVAYRVVYTILPHGVFNSSQEDIATFGFLLGTFPTAPTVFVFASQYHVAMEIIAASLVLCTFLSAPIMYVAARMVLIPYATQDQYSEIVEDTQRDVSIASAISVVIVFILFLLVKRYRSYMHVFIMHLMVAIFIEVVCIELLDLVEDYKQIYWEFFFFALFFIGVLSSRTWMASTSIGLLVLLRKGPTKAERAWVPLMLGSWGIPIIITVLLVSICATQQLRLHKSLVDISFLFGEAQLVISLAVLVLCCTVATICTFLIVLTARSLQRKAKRNNRDQDEDIKITRDNSSCNSVKLKHARPSPEGRKTPINATPYYGSNSETISNQDEEEGVGGVIFVDSSQNSPYLSKERDEGDETAPLLEGAAKGEGESHGDQSAADLGFGVISEATGLWYRDLAGRHLIRFVVLLLLLVLSSFVGILIVLWKILSKEITGIFIAINVLDTITNFGQGIFILLVFIFEKHWFWMVMYNKLRALFFKIETVIIPPKHELGASVVSCCSTFRTRHMEQCKEDIMSERRYFFWTFQSVFTGTDLVDWLLQQNIVPDREEGVQYGHALMMGGVLAHVQEEHYFHDSGYFYRFSE